MQRGRPTQEAANSLGRLNVYVFGEKGTAERCGGGAKGDSGRMSRSQRRKGSRLSR